MTHTKSGVRTNGAHSLLKPCAMMKGERERERERVGGKKEKVRERGWGERDNVM